MTITIGDSKLNVVEDLGWQGGRRAVLVAVGGQDRVAVKEPWGWRFWDKHDRIAGCGMLKGDK